MVLNDQNTTIVLSVFKLWQTVPSMKVLNMMSHCTALNFVSINNPNKINGYRITFIVQYT